MAERRQRRSSSAVCAADIDVGGPADAERGVAGQRLVQPHLATRRRSQQLLVDQGHHSPCLEPRFRSPSRTIGPTSVDVAGAQREEDVARLQDVEHCRRRLVEGGDEAGLRPRSPPCASSSALMPAAIVSRAA